MLRNLVYRISGFLLPALARVSGANDAVGIIMAHGVHRNAEAALPPPRSSVDLEAFRRNILGVQEAFEFVSMDDVADMISGKSPWRSNCLALTFDDSLKCHSELMAPKLVEWGIPATFYLSTAAIDRQAPYWWMRLEYMTAKSRGQKVCITLPGGREVQVDFARPSEARLTLAVAIRSHATPPDCEKAVDSIGEQLGVSSEHLTKEFPFGAPMNWEDARKLARLGMTIGSHTVSHPNLTLIDNEQMRAEFADSKRQIERECAVTCRHLCYPHGFYSETARQAARTCGYETAVTTESGWNRRNGDAERLARFSMPARAGKLPYLLIRQGHHAAGAPALN